VVGAVPAVETVTLGQRHGLGLPGGTDPRYVVRVDVPTATVTVGAKHDLLVDHVELADLVWVGAPVDGPLLAQTSAHGAPHPCRAEGSTVVFDAPVRRVAPGQSVVLYDGEVVVAGGLVT
ncbi:MAG: aminomethyltransferase beta-barrel domain-containing protein, partial [Acidimicrobiales bacterium]